MSQYLGWETLEESDLLVELHIVWAELVYLIL